MFMIYLMYCHQVFDHFDIINRDLTKRAKIINDTPQQWLVPEEDDEYVESMQESYKDIILDLENVFCVLTTREEEYCSHFINYKTC